MKDAVLARIFTGHERSPCRWGNWRKDRLKGSGHTRLHQLCQVRHTTFGDPGTDECPRRCVQTYDYCLGAFLHFAVMMRVQSRFRSDQRLLIFMVSIKILQKKQANHHRSLINFSAWGGVVKDEVSAVPSISCGTGKPNNCKIVGAMSVIRSPSIRRPPEIPPPAGRKRKIPFSAWFAPSGPVSFSKVCIFPPPTVPTERQ